MGNTTIKIVDGDRGKNYPKQTEFASEGFCLFLNAGNVTADGFDFTTQSFISEQRDNLLRKGKLQRFDVILSTRGTLGNVAYFDNAVEQEHIRINSGMVILRTDENSVSSWFLYALLKSPVFQNQIQEFITGSAQPQLPIQILNQFIIPLPPLSEQRKIASILSTWDAAIEQTRKLLEANRQLKAGLMQRLLSPKESNPFFSKVPLVVQDTTNTSLIFPYEKGIRENKGAKELASSATKGQGKNKWKCVMLGEIAEIKMGTSPPSKDYNNGEVGLPLIQGNADIKNRVSNPNVWTSTITQKCFVGDILMSVRAPVGTIALSKHNACIGRGICAIRSREQTNIDFLYQYLVFIEPEWRKISQGSTFESVTSTDIRLCTIILPPLPEQRKIAEILSTVDKYTILLRKSLEKLTQQKRGLMQKLLTGEIRV